MAINWIQSYMGQKIDGHKIEFQSYVGQKIEVGFEAYMAYVYHLRTLF